MDFRVSFDCLASFVDIMIIFSYQISSVGLPIGFLDEPTVEGFLRNSGNEV